MKRASYFSEALRLAAQWPDRLTAKSAFSGAVLAGLVATGIASLSDDFWTLFETDVAVAQENTSLSGEDSAQDDEFDVEHSTPPIWMVDMNDSGLGKSPAAKEAADIASREEHRASSKWPTYDEEKFQNFLRVNTGTVPPAPLSGEEFRDPTIEEMNRIVGEWCDRENGKHLIIKPSLRGLELQFRFSTPQITGVKVTKSVWPIPGHTKSTITYALPNFSGWETGAYMEIYNNSQELALYRRFRDQDGWQQSRGTQLFKCPT